MESQHNIRLTTGEISQLWSNYMSDTMGQCILKYFLNKVEDSEIRPVLEYAYSLTEKHIALIASIFNKEDFPLPVGFTDDDVNVNSPKLFSDSLMLQYIKQMGIAGITTYGIAQSASARSDVRDHFKECLSSSSELLDKATKLLLSKGLFIRPPYIPTPESAEFVKKEGFLNGYFGDRRPLNSLEIMNLFLNILTNVRGRAMTLGFSQVAKSQEVVDYLVRGREIASKHIEVFSKVLKDDDLPAPMTWDTDVTDSTDAPFSDKLMLFHTLLLNGIGIGNYGFAIGSSPRRDLGAMYARLSAEIATFADDGAELLIEKGWMEKLPGAVDRDALIQA